MLVHLTEWLIVILTLYLIMVKYDFSVFIYTSLLLVLMIELFFVYNKYKKNCLEMFEDTKVAPTATELHTLDTIGMSKLWKIPGVVQTNVVGGVQAVIDSTSSDDEMATLYDTNSKYKDAELRKSYKHIDYLLEKIRLFDSKIYEALVPQWTDADYETMKKDDDDGMKSN